MGKGDIKTRRGKLFNGSFGKRRPAKKAKNKASVVNKPLVKETKPKAAGKPVTEKKEPPKKAVKETKETKEKEE